MSTLGEGFVAIRPLVNSGLFGSELGTLLSGPLRTLEAGLSGNLEDKLTKIASAFGASDSAAASFGAGAAALTPIVAGAGVAIGAETALIKDSVGAYEDLASQVVQLQRVTGATAEDSSRLVAVFNEYGVSVQGGATALLRFDNNLRAHKASLADLGVTEALNNKGELDTIGTLENLAGAYAATTDEAKRTDLIVQAFGTRIGAQLIPLLEQGKIGLQDLFKQVPTGVIFDQAQIDRAVTFRAETERLSQSFKGLEAQAGSQLVPTLLTLSTGFEHIINDVDGVVKHVGGLGAVFNGFLTSIPVFGPLINGLEATAGSSDKAAVAAQKAADAENALSKATDTAEKSVESLASAQTAYSDEQQTIIDDTQKIADLTSQVSDLQLTSAATQDLFTHNQQDLATAENQVTDATYRQSQALTALNDILHPSAENVGKANLAVAQAQTGLAEANQNVIDATRNLHDIEAHSLNDPRVPAARLALQSAQEGVTAATYALTDAQQRQHDLVNPQGTDALTQAEHTYQDSLNATQTAIDNAAAKKKIVDDEQANRLKDLATKTDELNRTENQLAKDRQTLGFDAIKLVNAQEALASDVLIPGVNKGLADELDLIAKLYPAAATAIKQIESLIPTGPAGNTSDPLAPGSGAGDAARSQFPPAPSTAPSGVPAPPSLGGPPSASIPTGRDASYGTTIIVNPSAGLSETQIGQSAAQALMFGMQR